MFDLPQGFLARMKLQLGNSFEDFLNSYSRPAEKAIRVNTLKISVEDFKKITPFALSPVPWEPDGFYVDEEKPGKTPLHAAGAYYVQEPSAMSAAPRLEVKPGEKVLDLCAAPGGKGTQLAQKMRGEGVIILNEISFPRAKILSQNVERLGITNAVVTCAPPQSLCPALEGYFDKILIDAPCSGEGMFKKEENAIPGWSLKNVQMCAQRQREIIASGAKLLRAGGRLVYSTCTFSPEEDEEIVSFLLKADPSFRLMEMQKLYPHEIRGEGHFYAVLEKGEGKTASVPAASFRSVDKKLLSAYRQWAGETGVSLKNVVQVNDSLCAVPNDMPETGVQILRAGVKIGALQKDRFIPDHALAMSLKSGGVQSAELNFEEAVSYLKGLALPCAQGLKGWTLVTCSGLPLGWGKAAGGVLKNHLPKGLRI